MTRALPEYYGNYDHKSNEICTGILILSSQVLPHMKR